MLGYMEKMAKAGITAIVTLLMATSSTQADYTSNVVGRITNVLTYDTGHFLITLSTMPEGPCGYYFIVPSEVPVDGRQMLLSRALLAKSTGEMVNIGYDAHTCVNGWYRVHRIG